MEVTLTEFNFFIFISSSYVSVLWTRNAKSVPLIVHSNTNYICVNTMFNFVPVLFLKNANKIIQYKLLTSPQHHNVWFILLLPIPQLVTYSAAFSVNIGKEIKIINLKLLTLFLGRTVKTTNLFPEISLPRHICTVHKMQLNTRTAVQIHCLLCTATRWTKQTATGQRWRAGTQVDVALSG
jgi:hypothetical protein